MHIMHSCVSTKTFTTSLAGKLTNKINNNCSQLQNREVSLTLGASSAIVIFETLTEDKFKSQVLTANQSVCEVREMVLVRRLEVLVSKMGL